MFVSKKKYDELQAMFDVANSEVEHLIKGHKEGCDRMAKRVIATEQERDELKELCEALDVEAHRLQTERDRWQEDYDKLFTSLSLSLDEKFQLQKDNDALVAEGAKLANELAKLRKAPEIKGMSLTWRDGTHVYIEGCVELCPCTYADGTTWFDALNHRGASLGLYRESDIVATAPVYATPTPKKRGARCG